MDKVLLDLRWCNSCNQLSYLRKGACINRACA
jgi:hypothetical protein